MTIRTIGTFRVFALVLVGPLAGRPCEAQGVRGKVAVIETAEPIPLAAVLLYGPDSVAYAATLTDSLGRFELRAPAPGSYVVRAHRIGYHGVASDPIELPAHVTLEVRVNLRPIAHLLEAITVYGEAPRSRELNEFHRRRELRRGINFSRKEIEEMRAGTVADLMLLVPGYRVVHLPRGQRRLSFTSARCEPTIYVDGREMRGGLFWSIEGLPMSWVYGVEVFRNSSDAPPEYRPVDPLRWRCGVVLIWTVSLER